MNNYDHYIAVDWSMSSMAIARLTGVSERLSALNQPASVSELKTYLGALRGSKILTLEESNSSQWLYTELREHVDRLFICDPHRNHLLSEGEKDDPIDAKKLVKLLRADLMKEVYHSCDDFIYMRKLISHFQDLVKMGVIAKNQRSALFRSYGLCHKSEDFKSGHKVEDFVLEQLDAQIAFYEQKREVYESKFTEVIRKNPIAKKLKSIPGVGDIFAVEILAIIVNAKRFPSIGHLYSYSGLVRLQRKSGGRSYGSKVPRYNRGLKRVFKMATMTAIRGNNRIASYYRHLIETKKYPPHQARHACSRKIAAFAYGVMKTGRKLDKKSND